MRHGRHEAGRSRAWWPTFATANDRSCCRAASKKPSRREDARFCPSQTYGDPMYTLFALF
jgi:hypothetical protein